MSGERETLRRTRADETWRRDAEATVRRKQPSVPARAPGFFPSLAGGERRQLEVVRRLASGGEGDVYLCRDASAWKAVKVLRLDTDSDILRSLMLNQTLLEDACLVPLEYVGSMRDLPGQTADARTYLVSPYYPGGDLSGTEVLRRINPSADTEDSGKAADPAQLNLAEFCRLTAQIHQAVQLLHSGQLMDGACVVHRDIRPQNILLDPDGTYRLGDFGLASVLESGMQMKLTRRFGLSHGYSPPEAYAPARLAQPVSRKYDYFSLGMTLLHAALGGPRYRIAATGQNPRPGEISADDFYEIIALSRVQIPAALPERVRTLLSGLTLASPEHRWGAEEVNAWLAGKDPAVHIPSLERGSGISVRVNGQTWTGEKEVCEAIVRYWDLFSTLLTSGQLAFRWQDPDLAVRRAVEKAVAEGQGRDPETGLREVLRQIMPDCGHVFAGRRYATDQELGRAMMAAGKDDIAVLARYLTSGGLRPQQDSVQNAAQRDAVAVLEAYAALQPLAAVQHMGRLLTGTPLPPLQIPLSEGGELVLSLEDLMRELSHLTTEMLERYTALSSVPRPDLMPVPGCYGTGSRLCVVQPDGSVLAEPTPLGTPIPLSTRFQDILQWMCGGTRLSSVSDLDPLLFLHMYQAGWIRADVKLPETGGGGSFGWTLSEIMVLLSVFPAFRLEHGLDEQFRAYFAHARRLLDGSADLVPPRSSGPRTGSANAARQAAKDAVAVFERTREWTDLVQAVDVVTCSLRTAAASAPAVYAAAVRLARVFSLVFGGTNRRRQQEYDEMIREYEASGGGPGALGRLIAALDRMEARAQTDSREDLGRFALSWEMEFLRDLSRKKPGTVDFVVPDTTDAEQYYTELQRWAAGRRRKRRFAAK